MTHRSFLQRAARAGLGGLAIVLGILMPSGIPVIPAVLGTQLAYDGSDRRIIAWTVGFLVLIELLFAVDLGSLSLSYLIAAGILSLASRLVTVPPWAGADGWSLPDAIRTLVASFGTAVAAMTVSVLIGALYGNGLLMERVSAQLTPIRLILLAISCAVVLLVARRIDIPFRRRIRFGT